MDVKALVYPPFYQVDTSRQRTEEGGIAEEEQVSSGIGLGLAIVQWIVQAHRGEIKVTSMPGQGSTIEVRLPAFATTPDL
jgi:signal transduction histidine kinase